MTPFPAIPRYDLVEEVGHGGMSVVYRARDTQLDRVVAVKVLHRHLAGRPEERRRFRREAQAVARLHHPNILEIHDYSGEESDEAWLVSEFIEGPTLRRFADTVGFGLPEIGALVAEQLAGALAHAHTAGVIHRDVKPENVLIRPDGSVALADFGVARMIDRDERMTMTGALMGSPAHMAPEVVEGRGSDARSDVFSLGTVLYWLVCGRLPFTGASPAEVLRRIGDGRYEDPRAVDPRISDDLAHIVGTALEPDPARRYADAGALQAALRGLLADLDLDPPDAELRRFFEDPTGYKTTLRSRLVAAWMSRGEQAAAEGRTADVIRACDRVLTLSPGHEGASRLLADVHRRRRRRRAAAALGGAAFGALALLLVAWGLTRVPLQPADAAAGPRASGGSLPGDVGDAPSPPPLLRPVEGPAAAPAAAASAPSDEALEAAASPSETAVPAVEGPPREARRPLRVLVTPFARIYLDGRLVAQDIERRGLLAAGTHELRLEREGFVTVEEEIRIPPGEEPLEIRRRLTPRPARLRIVNEQGAAVSVDGELRGTVGAAGLELPMTFPDRPGGGAQYPLTVLVRLEKPGFLPLEQEVRLEPGRTAEVRAELEPEP